MAAAQPLSGAASGASPRRKADYRLGEAVLSSPTKRPYKIHVRSWREGDGVAESTILGNAATTVHDVICAACIRSRPHGPWPGNHLALVLVPDGARGPARGDTSVTELAAVPPLLYSRKPLTASEAVKRALQRSGEAHFRLAKQADLQDSSAGCTCSCCVQ
eukprot:TRINITY_DN62120_c0_g1_i1.p2 TRINITY_DN62120_c0_g1~~TRINITY_DN62120_c0_g1_i1.p2  ORF type:complete len:185 (+),score=46.87 TRINITY_DN62120_c0_g1_i1:74-556(+)